MPLRATQQRQKPSPPCRSGPAGLHLYVIQSDVTGAVKIGRSSKPEQRLDQLQTGSPYRLRLLAVYEGRGEEEQRIHRLVSRHRLKQEGEWFHHDCLPDLPEWVYAQLPFEDDWWVQVGPRRA